MENVYALRQEQGVDELSLLIVLPCFHLTLLFYFAASRVEGHRSLEPVLPEQNDAAPASLPVAGAGADPTEALPGSETPVSASAGSKRKLEEE